MKLGISASGGIRIYREEIYDKARKRAGSLGNKA
ncbi:MAG TPA: carbon storage regulator [Firmicutes bacterium]|nr:carbon storage regulator [Bacillota bacterium]